jgi:hypothetical protein
VASAPTPRHQVRLYDPVTGRQLAVLGTWKSLSVEHTLNWFGTHTFSVDLNAPCVEHLRVLDCILELRRDVGSGWYTEYVGFCRTPQESLSADDHEIFVSYGRSATDLLHRREIMYPANTAYTLKSGPGENVIKAYVRENATVGAVAPPRKRALLTPNTLLVEDDAGRGDDWFGMRSNKNLLEVIREIAVATGVDYTVRRVVGGGVGGVPAFEFVVGFNVDRRETVTFAPELGNMASPDYTHSRTEEATVVNVLGQGEGRARRQLIRESDARLDSPWNDIEVSVNASGESQTFDALSTAGDEKLEELAARESFKFEVLQTASLRYGRDYWMGDTVTAKFGGRVRYKKLTEARIVVSPDTTPEEVVLTFSDQAE